MGRSMTDSGKITERQFVQKVAQNVLSCIPVSSIVGLVTEYDLTDEVDRYERNCRELIPMDLLKISSKIGRIDFFLHRTMKSLNIQDKRILLGIAAANGHISILDLLRNRWKLSPIDARSNNNYALRSAATNGHAEVLIELRTNWGLLREDFSSSNCSSKRTC